ncbi:MAG: hypothetical protein IPK87_09540 [Planctomycetes bacterium]|nr:hypothetical protein [Planctomycetota bacterium]
MRRFVPLLLLLAGCSNPEPQPANEPVPQNKPEPKPEPEPAPKAETRGKLEAADAPEQTRAVGLIEQVTGRKFKTRVPVYVFSQEELEAEVKSWGDYAPENILGFYKYDTKAMYLVPEAAGNKRAFGLRLHEGTHALQDQLYDLAKLHKAVTTQDEDNTVTALIEGQAVQVMIDALPDNPHVKRITEVKQPTDLSDDGAWLRVLYYSYGAVFVQNLKERDGYEAVDAAFKALPKSTEQILHPEKYPAELPDRVSLPADLPWPAGFKAEASTTTGEFSVLVAMHRAGVSDSAAAAAGWGGDIEVTARKGASWITLRVTTWDTREDAQEYHDGMQGALNLRVARWNNTEGEDGRRVSLVFADPDVDTAVLDALAEALVRATVEYHK